MNASPLSADHAPMTVAASSRLTPGVDRPFAEHLGRARAAGRETTAREAAEQFVSTAFIKPVLALLREGTSAGAPFAPGDAERRFGPLLDEQIADRVVKAANFSLVDVVQERLHATAAPARTAAPIAPARAGAHSSDSLPDPIHA